MELNFEKMYYISNCALNLNRSHPCLKKNFKWLLELSVILGIFLFDGYTIFYNIICINLKMNDFTMTCKNSVMAISFALITYKYTVLIVHQSTIRGLIDKMQNDYNLTKNLSKKEQAIVFKYADNGRLICKQWLVLCILGSLTFFAKSIVIYVHNYLRGEFRYVPFYDVTYPNFLEKHKSQISGYLVAYFLEVYFDYVICCTYVAFVPLGPIFMLHAVAQLEIIKLKIDDIFTDQDEEIIEAKLKYILVRLQYIHSFIADVESSFHFYYEVTLKLVSLIFPLCIYQIIETLKQGIFSLEFMAFVFGGIMITSAPCYYSNLLMETGEKVRQAIYSCGWETNYNMRARTTIRLMNLYALKPIAIRTVFSVLCLESLSDVSQQSYTIFNLMISMWN